ncbi:MAG: holin family protein [Candidatus Polarisedimenticolaceae bacterium]|nr:holin family protein [Candidatus Polarisedimenticolaceae bacterium]
MSVFAFISNIFEPATKLVDELNGSSEEKLQIKHEINKAENELLAKVIDYEKQLLEGEKKLMLAEAMNQSWLQRSWRPITMLTFLLLVTLHSFGLLANPLGEDAWLLLQIGLGGYVAGRSAEKITKHYVGKSMNQTPPSDAKG